MSGFALGLLSFPILLALVALRIPIAVAMLVVGGGGYAILNGWLPLIQYLKTAPYYLFSTYSLSVIPMFLLMGQFATKAGISRGLFQAANVWLGRFRGGMAMAVIGACAGFGAICGSSLATAATMGQAALPEMKRFNYSGALSTGVLAAGGTLGILIPPSIVLVIYAILTEQSIAKMFAAAFAPGLLAALGYMAAIAVFVRFFPDAGPAGEPASNRERLQSLIQVWPVLVIFVLVIGGIYGGWFTPTEAAAIGAFSTGALAIGRGDLKLQGFIACLQQTAGATAMIFLILLGAEVYNAFLALTQMPMQAAQMLSQSQLPSLLLLMAMLLIYLILGCFMDSLSMILLTIPIFFPIVVGLDFGLNPDETAIWFGILALVVVEVGLITPPVGMNVFIINSMAKDVTMLETFKGVTPFLISDTLRVALLVTFPDISLWLVRFLT